MKLSFIHLYDSTIMNKNIRGGFYYIVTGPFYISLYYCSDLKLFILNNPNPNLNIEDQVKQELKKL